MGRFLFSALFFTLFCLALSTNSFAGDCRTGTTYGDVNNGTFSSCDLQSNGWIFYATGCAKVKCLKGETVGAIQNKCVIAGADGGYNGPTKEYTFNPGEERRFDFKGSDLFSTYYGEVKFTAIRYEGGGCPDRLGLR